MHELRRWMNALTEEIVTHIKSQYAQGEFPIHKNGDRADFKDVWKARIDNKEPIRGLLDGDDLYFWDAFVASAGRPCAGLGFFTEQMRELLFIEQRRIEHKAALAPYDPATSEHPVSRVALRRVLLGGLGDAVHFGKELVRYELTDDAVTARFADGSSARGDVLVAADGVGSRVRQQYLPHAKVVDTGIVAVGGKLALDAPSRRWLPGALTRRLTNVLPPRGCGMFIAPYEAKQDRRPLTRLLTRQGDASMLHAELGCHSQHSRINWIWTSPRRHSQQLCSSARNRSR